MYEESGCSRTAAAICAYLIKKNNLKLKVSTIGVTHRTLRMTIMIMNSISIQDAYEHVKKCGSNVLPLQTFLDQLSVWESQTLE